MFSLINLILTIIILIRVFKTDKFFSVYYQMTIKEDNNRSNNFKKGQKNG